MVHYVKVAGRWIYLYRAIDQYGQVIDVLVSPKRDSATTPILYPCPQRWLTPRRGVH
jgi:transposase-like protein